MTRYLRFLIVLVVLPTKLLAEQLRSNVSTFPPVDTVYFDQDWERTAIAEDRKFARILRRSPEGRPSGTVRDYYYPSWKKQWEGKLASEAPDVAHGLCTAWHENGRLYFRGTFVRGQAQDDYQEWRDNGKLIKCRYETSEALPISVAKLLPTSGFHIDENRHVFSVDIPASATGIVYKLDLRDEGQPPVTWSSALAIGAAFAAPISASTALLASSRALAQTDRSAPATFSTKCRWYVTDQLPAMKAFTDNGVIPDSLDCYRRAYNVCQETRELSLRGARRLYICVSNLNTLTDARATLRVVSVTKACQ